MTNSETISKLHNALSALIKSYDEAIKENESFKKRILELELRSSELARINERLQRELNQIKEYSEDDKSNLSSIIGKIENILHKNGNEIDLNIKQTMNNNYSSIIEEPIIKEESIHKKDIQTTLNLEDSTFEEILEKNIKHNEVIEIESNPNKIDLTRMTSMLNGFNNK